MVRLIGGYELSLEDLPIFTSRLFWITYRHNFPFINSTSFEGDAGWGCMIRSGQMLTATSMASAILGQNWNSNLVDEHFRRFVIQHFLDNHDSPLSIHNIVVDGTQMGKKAGEWHVPSITARCICNLINSELSIGLRSFCITDMTINREEIVPLLDGAKVLLWIPVRLAVSDLSEEHVENVKQFLSLPNCVGIAGGRPNSSLYFYGFEGDHLLYLDPHFSRPYAESGILTSEELETYSYSQIRSIPITSIDPCFVVGYLISDLDDLNRWMIMISNISTANGDSLISIMNECRKENKLLLDIVDDDMVDVGFEPL